MPECLAHACRQAPLEPGYGMSGIQFDRALDSRHALSALRAGARLAKRAGMTMAYMQSESALKDRQS